VLRSVRDGDVRELEGPRIDRRVPAPERLIDPDADEEALHVEKDLSFGRGQRARPSNDLEYQGSIPVKGSKVGDRATKRSRKAPVPRGHGTPWLGADSAFHKRPSFGAISNGTPDALPVIG
jgi:hypothetical protein